MSDGMDVTTQIRDAIIERGYCVIEDLIAADDVAELRDFWISAFSAKSERGPAIWTPYLGEPNHVMFHANKFVHFYRSYDFLWNNPLHDKTRELALKLNAMRNAVTESDPYAGRTFTSDRYGVYITTSYYPPSHGALVEHRDFTDGRRHWHYVLPLTFKGTDFAAGGLFLTDRAGQSVDLEADVKPGSVIFYDGGLPHRVERIDGDAKLGRLQMFAIQTKFDLPEQSERMSERISPIKYVGDRLRALKHRLSS